MINERLELAYECLSAIGNSLEVDSMTAEILWVFSRKTGAMSAKYYKHLDDEKPMVSVGKEIVPLFNRDDIQVQEYILYKQDGLDVIIIPLRYGFLIFFYKNIENLDEIGKMLGGFQVKINLALNACVDVRELEAVNAELVSTKEVLDENVGILFEKKERLEELTEEVNAASKTKSEFLANINHEIRTPLNAILGFVELLKEENISEGSLKYVDIIDSSSRSLLHIMEDILEFSKIKGEKLDIRKMNFDTKKEFEITTYLFKAKCSQKNISLTLKLGKTLPKYINSDPFRIKQVVSHLVSNAVEFTPRGKGITLDISYKDNAACISVKDEGAGIAKDKQKEIFSAFNQEDNSSTRKHGGTGLGLAISSEIVRLLGGELKVKSELGVGSEFYFSLPVEVIDEKNFIENNNKHIYFKGHKVLLAEDNQANQAFMKVVFKKLHLEFDIANDGLQAVEAFKNDQYDLILMDENMPNLSGIEATKAIAKIEKEQNLRHTPIIALTANALEGDRERFLDAGMDEYLTKPLDRVKLNTVLSECFNDINISDNTKVKE
ncbi:MAG: response regulator [Sulfurimonas sp.]|nr:response regulator [Sulfurimonas sp.]